MIMCWLEDRPATLYLLIDLIQYMYEEYNSHTTKPAFGRPVDYQSVGIIAPIPRNIRKINPQNLISASRVNF